MAKTMTLTKHARFATVKRNDKTHKYKLTRSSRSRAIRLLRENDLLRDYNIKRIFFVESTTGL